MIIKRPQKKIKKIFNREWDIFFQEFGVRELTKWLGSKNNLDLSYFCFILALFFIVHFHGEYILVTWKKCAIFLGTYVYVCMHILILTSQSLWEMAENQGERVFTLGAMVYLLFATIVPSKGLGPL